MKNPVVESYENYREENRLTTNNARRIEFLTTVRIFEEHFGQQQKILDCAAGTGVYAFHLAEQGHQLTATDITPRHIDVIREQLKEKAYSMETAVLDARDLSCFEDESFDVVLNMGPFYHLLTEADREQCMKECLRVLKKGGLLVTAYIPRFYVFQYVAMQDSKYLDARLAKQLISTGELHHDDEKCFWTDTYYSTAEEMEQLYQKHSLELVDHFAQDGTTPHFSAAVDQWNEEQFAIWCEHHYNICRERSLLGASNHVVLIGRKS